MKFAILHSGATNDVGGKSERSDERPAGVVSALWTLMSRNWFSRL